MGTRRSIVSTVGLAAGLVAYSNADAWLELRASRDIPDRVNWSHLAVLAAVLAWASAERFSPRDLGVQFAGIGRSLGWGLLAGTAGSLLVSLFFAFPVVDDQRHIIGIVDVDLLTGEVFQITEPQAVNEDLWATPIPAAVR